MIENEQDSVFVLKDALIKYNSKTDLRFRVEADPNQKRDSSYVYRNDIVVNKHLELSNVQFVYNVNSYSRYFEGVLLDIHFKKSILLEDVKSLYLQYCRFEEAFRYTLSNCDQKFSNKAGYDDLANFEYTDFSSSFSFYNNCSNSSLQNSQYFLENSSLTPRILDLNLNSSNSFKLKLMAVENNSRVLLSTFNNKAIADPPTGLLNCIALLPKPFKPSSNGFLAIFDLIVYSESSIGFISNSMRTALFVISLIIGFFYCFITYG